MQPFRKQLKSRVEPTTFAVLSIMSKGSIPNVSPFEVFWRFFSCLEFWGLWSASWKGLHLMHIQPSTLSSSSEKAIHSMQNLAVQYPFGHFSPAALESLPSIPVFPRLFSTQQNENVPFSLLSPILYDTLHTLRRAVQNTLPGWVKPPSFTGVLKYREEPAYHKSLHYKANPNVSIIELQPSVTSDLSALVNEASLGILR